MTLNNKLKAGVSTLALTAGLGMVVMSAPAQAGSLPPPACVANFTPGNDQSSFVTDSVTPLPNNGGFQYGFTLCNTSDPNFSGAGFNAIRDWELPFFGTDLDTDNVSQISAILSPRGWGVRLEEIDSPNGATGWDGVAAFQQDGDPFKVFFDNLYDGEANNPFNTVTHVLHWFTNACSQGGEGQDEDGGDIDLSGEEFCALQEQEFTGFFDPILPGGDFQENEEIGIGFRSGFGFESPFPSGAAPYQASWVEVPNQSGDPQFPLVGGSPDGPGLNLRQLNEVPEPGVLALFGTGLAGLLLAGRRRRKSTDET